MFNSATLNNTNSVNNSSYIEFSVTANANAQLNVASLSFKRDASNSAPNQLEVRYSTDGFATFTSWGAAPNTPTTGASITWNFADFSVPSGTTLTFRFYPYGTQRADLGTGTSSGTTGTFSVDDVSLIGTSPLPVNLVSFTGKSGNNEVMLNWLTAWEEENQGFEILKSTNAKSFERIGMVAGKYNAQVQSEYAFVDQHVTAGQIYYYRLKQKDAGGESALSQIIAVLAEATEQQEGSIAPNPNDGSFSLLGQAVPPANVRLFNAAGADIPINTEENKAQKALNIQSRIHLSPGIYYLQVNPGDGSKIKVRKVLINQQ
ncbi:T9SS type A sorting domain-containing protein [Spirosoma aerophilum]